MLRLLTLTLILLTARAATAQSLSFDRSGVIVDVHTFFDLAYDSVEIAQGETAGRALVTAEGVYAFLETPENQKALAGT